MIEGQNECVSQDRGGGGEGSGGSHHHDSVREKGEEVQCQQWEQQPVELLTLAVWQL